MNVMLTANIGGIDNFNGLVKQDCAESFLFNEHNLPYPMPNFGSRLQSKFIKIQTHRFMPYAKNFIWYDARIEIASPDFAEFMLSELKGHDIAISRHSQRKTIGEEMEYIMDHIKQGSPYLTSRYADQQMEREYAFYKNMKAENLPLYHCNLFARKSNLFVNTEFDEWWFGTTMFSNFDQAYFSYACKNLRIKEINFEERNKHIVIHKHK